MTEITEINTISNNFVYSDTSIINPVDGINLFDGLYHPVKSFNINTSGTINITDTSSSSKWQLYIIHGTISRDISNEIAMFSITCNLVDIKASTIIPADIHNSLNYVNIRVPPRYARSISQIIINAYDSAFNEVNELYTVDISVDKYVL